jgi:hypothetical protein
MGARMRDGASIVVLARSPSKLAALFGGSASAGTWDDGTEGGVGVREPRRLGVPEVGAAVPATSFSKPA